MITTLIGSHLNVLGEGVAKGIKLSDFEHICVKNRSNIERLTRIVGLRYSTWNIVLSSDVLIEALNNEVADDNILNELCSSLYPSEQIAQVVNLPYLGDVYNKTKTAYEEAPQWLRKSGTILLSNCMIDVLLYVMTYGYTGGTVDEVIATVLSINQKSYIREAFSKMENASDRVSFIRVYGTLYTKNNDLEWQLEFDLIKRCAHHLEFYEEFRLVVGDVILKKCFKQIQDSLDESKDPEAMKNHLLTLILSIDTELITDWILQLWGEEHVYVLDGEVSRLAKHATSRPSNDVYSVIYGDQSVAYEAIKNWRELSDSQLRLIKECIETSKKGFLRLISGNERAKECFMRMGRSKLLFSPEFKDIVNLNTLNEKNLSEIIDMHYDKDKVERLDRKLQLTFDEFQCLYGKPEIDIKLYYRLLPELSVGERLRVFRELPSMESVSDLFQTNDELFERVVELVNKKPMMQWVAEKKIKLENAGPKHYLIMLLVPERFEKFKSSIKKGLDVEFVIRESELASISESLDEAKFMFVGKDEQCQYLLSQLNLSREFVEKYKANIISYYERGLCEIFSFLHKGSEFESLQKKNLILITKAELSGKLQDLKFVLEDFELEIGLPISSEVILQWMQNRTARAAGFFISETYDYETTLRIGQYPKQTCQNWHGGIYSRCLLSNFDTNKKLLVARGQKQHIVARAILRLTKGTDRYIPKEEPRKKLAFKDMVDIEQTAEGLDEVPAEERLILFLERCYTSMDGQEAVNVRREFIRLAKQKAEDLGAQLVLADDYKKGNFEELNEFELKSSYVFISYSKNGHQYLDSLSGQASEENEGIYKEATLLLQKQQYGEKVTNEIKGKRAIQARK